MDWLGKRLQRTLKSSQKYGDALLFLQQAQSELVVAIAEWSQDEEQPDYGSQQGGH